MLGIWNNHTDSYFHCPNLDFYSPAGLGKHCRASHPELEWSDVFLGSNSLVCCEFCQLPFASAGIKKHVHACKASHQHQEEVEKDRSEACHAPEASENSSKFSGVSNSVALRLDALRRGVAGEIDGWNEFLEPVVKPTGKDDTPEEPAWEDEGEEPLYSKLVSASRKLRHGSLRKATQMLESEGVAEPSEEVKEKLRDLHPRRKEDFPRVRGSFFSVSLRSLQSCLASVPLDGSPGPSGVTFKQLQQMGALSGGAEVLRQACEAILNGKCPVKDRMCQANLIALKKDGGKGIRPIAISETLLRLAGRIACRTLSKPLGLFFKGVQFGAGTKGGLEAVVHSCREGVRSGKSLLQVDCKNAFNSISRGRIAKALENHFPTLVPYFVWAYGEDTPFDKMTTV